MKKVRSYYKSLNTTRERIAFFWFWSIAIIGVSIFLGAAVADFGFLAVLGLGIYFLLLVGFFASAYVLCHREKPVEPTEDNWEDLL